jgi:uncharacterized DUF497 family protein
MSDVDVEWDEGKARANLRKHGVGFAEAVFVFSDRRAVTLNDDRHGEPRHVTIARDSLGRLLVVVFTFRRANIRLISARRATARERRIYEEGP